MREESKPAGPKSAPLLKVLLIANYVPDGQNSMQAFKEVLERELPQHGCEVRVLAPSPRVLGHFATTSRWWKWAGYVDKFILFLPTLASALRWADVVHICDHSNAMYVPRVLGKPNLVTCHDVIAIQASLGMVPGWDVGRSGRLFQRLIAKGLARADLIACVSDLTRRDLLKLRLADEAKVTTVSNGLNAAFSPMPVAEAGRLMARFGLSPRDRYLVHVGMDLPRKNRPAVLEAFIALQRRAAAAGTVPVADKLLFVGPELPPPLMALAREAGIEAQLLTAQQISHDELRALYASAVALVFPSLQEGFGWPVIEAQACGCPVFTSDLAPMNEIGGEAAVYVDPHDSEKIALAIEQAAPRLGWMRTEGLANATHYAPPQMTLNYIAAYRRAIAQRKVAA